MNTSKLIQTVSELETSEATSLMEIKMTLSEIVTAYEAKAINSDVLIETLSIQSSRNGRFKVIDLQDVNWMESRYRNDCYANPMAALTHALLTSGALTVIDRSNNSVYECATVADWMQYRYEPIVTTSAYHKLNQAVDAMLTAISEGHDRAVTGYARYAAHQALAILG
jgi:hypothetical protein